MQKEKILVIDDEEVILELSRDILTEKHHDVKTASNGNDGPDVVEIFVSILQEKGLLKSKKSGSRS